MGAVVLASLIAGCQPGSASSQAPGAPAPGASSGPTAPPNADLFGTVKFVDSSSFTNPPNDPAGNGSDVSSATVNVVMARDATTKEFVDAGSTYSQNATTHRDKLIGVNPTCQGISDGHGEATDQSFSAPLAVDEPGRDISVLYSADLNVFTLFVNTFVSFTTTFNACMSGTAVTETHWVGGPLACGAFGLAGKVTSNPAGPDQVDMACTLDNGGGNSVTVTGTLTLKD